MKKRIGFAVWLLLACLLYFFENNTGTRVILACTLFLPFVPILRRSLLGKDEAGREPFLNTRNILSLADRMEDDPSDIRKYLPGDPVNRIHWKLSAKRDELLVLERARNSAAGEAEETAAAEDNAPVVRKPGRYVFPAGFSILFVSLVLFFVIPSAVPGIKVLLNRLFDASESVNAYTYEHFAVPANQTTISAIILLSGMGFVLIGMAVLSRSRLPALCLMAACVLFQVYFGLSFPSWISVPLFALFVLRMMKRPRKKKTVLTATAGIITVFLAVLLILPGVDAATEAASETVRDRLSQIAQSVTGSVREMPAGETETRHVHTLSLVAGDREARPDSEYRLVTTEEKQVSMPHWINYLRSALLLILAVALVILPFMPFLLLNRQRKKALDARKVFQSGNVSEAVFAVFQHVTAMLEATGNSGGNALYSVWNVDLCPGYAERFAACEKLFEEAAYSTHEMKEEHRQQVLELLNETEQTLRQKTGWKQRMRLRYKECLWI